MGRAIGDIRLRQMSDLLAYLEVDTLEQAGEVVGEHVDPDVCILEEDGGYVVRMSTHGCQLAFPTTVDQFWELVHDLEGDVVAALIADVEEDV